MSRYHPVLAAFVALAFTAGADPVSTAFSYQGRLNRTNGPANGTFDMKFELYNVAAGGAPVVPAIERPAQQISGGLFTVELDEFQREVPPEEPPFDPSPPSPPKPPRPPDPPAPALSPGFSSIRTGP